MVELLPPPSSTNHIINAVPQASLVQGIHTPGNMVLRQRQLGNGRLRNRHRNGKPLKKLTNDVKNYGIKKKRLFCIQQCSLLKLI